MSQKLNDKKSFKQRLYWLLLLLGIFHLYIRTIGSSIGAGGNHGELTASSWLLGNCHPTGYPVFQLIAKLFSFIPLGTIAYRTNVFAAISVTIAIAFLMLTLNRITKSAIFSWMSAFCFATTPLIWQQAVLTEVYSLNLLSYALVIYLFINYSPKSVQSSLLITFLVGLSFGNHLLIAFLALAVALLLVRHQIKYIMLHILCLIVALGAYLYLPIRANLNPGMNWGNPVTAEQFALHVTGMQFKNQMGDLYPGEWWYRTHDRLQELYHHVPLFWWTNALLGILFLVRKHKRMAICLVVTSLLLILTTIFYGIPDISEYASPLLLIIFVSGGTGFALVMHLLIKRLSSHYAAAVSLALLLIICIPSFLQGFAQSNCATNYLSADFGKALANSIPSKGILFFKGDNSGNALAYLQIIAHYREDVILYDENAQLLENPYGGFARDLAMRARLRRTILEKSQEPVLFTNKDENENQLRVKLDTWGLLYRPVTAKFNKLFQPCSPPDRNRFLIRLPDRILVQTEQELLSEYYIIMGDAAANSGYRSEAISTYRAVIPFTQELPHLALIVSARFWDLQLKRDAYELLLSISGRAQFSPYLWNNLSWYGLQVTDDAKRSLEHINHALALEPDNPAFRHTRAQAYIRLGDFKSALKDLEFAFQQNPFNKNYETDLLRIRKLLGDGDFIK